MKRGDTTHAQQEALNNALYKLAWVEGYPQKLTHGSLEQARQLLSQGADPNFTPQPPISCSLIECAVIMQDVPFLKLLAEFKANMELGAIELHQLGYFENRVKKNKETQTRFKLQAFPLQRAVQALKCDYLNEVWHDICHMLGEGSPILETFKSNLTERIQTLFAALKSKIKEALLAAEHNKKRLMILIGDDHDSVNSALIEMIIVTICAELNIQTVYAEQNKIMYNHMSTHGSRYSGENYWCTSISLQSFIKALNGKIIPIDLGHFGAIKCPNGQYEDLATSKHGFKNYSREGCRYRNTIMAEVADESSQEHVIAIMGGAHVNGMMNETNLTDNFHVFAVNTCTFEPHFSFSKYTNDCLKYLNSEQVFQVKLLTRLEETLLTPHLARKCVENALSEKLNKKPEQAKIPLATLPEKLSFWQSVNNTITDFISAPSKYPLVLSAIAVVAAFTAGASTLGMVAAGLSMYAGIKLRECAYQQQTISSFPVAFNEGKKAATSWVHYGRSYLNMNAWRHPIEFGKGMQDEMDKQVKRVQKVKMQ